MKKFILKAQIVISIANVN